MAERAGALEERQREELAVLSAIFAAELSVDPAAGPLSFTVALTGLAQAGRTPLLAVRLPADYPEAPPECALLVEPRVPASWQAALDECLACEAGAECVLQLVTCLNQLAPEPAAEPAPEPDPPREEEPPPMPPPEPVRATVVFDHIKAKSARKLIRQLASQLGLSGLLRPGKPGMVFVEGGPEPVAEFERLVRAQLSHCTRGMGCWGPANHHFQSISVLRHAGNGRGFGQFEELETESLMHLAHRFIPPYFSQPGGLEWFYEASGMPAGWAIPEGPGAADPYLKPRGGTKMKKSNKRIH